MYPKKRIIRRIVIVSLVCLVAVAYFACFPKPPSMASLEKRLNEHYSDFKAAADYFLALDYDDAAIFKDRDPASVFADFDYFDIEDESARNAVERLREIGCLSITKSTENNSIAFELWDSPQYVGAGVLYRINKDKSPTVEYLTELAETELDGWFAYVEDYNEWRSRASRAG